MAEAEVGLRTTLKDRVQTARGLREVEQGVDKVGRSAETAGARAKLGARGFDAMRKAGHFAGLAIKTAFAGALAAGFAGYEFLKGAVEIARESQKIQRLSTQTIRSTGGAANVSAGQIKRYSEALSVKTGIDRESIQTGENVLLMFKNVRNEVGKGNDIYKQATQAAVDLSSTPLFKGNVTTATKGIGKLLDDPVKNINALSRAGIQFSATQLDQIKAMVAQNDLLGAQKMILAQVNSVAGGAAAAQATWGDKAHQMWHNIEDEIGTALLPLLDSVERWFVRKGGKAVREYAHVAVEELVDVADHLGELETKARPFANRVLPSIATGLGDVRDILKVAAPYAVDLVGAFKGMPSWARKAIVGGALLGYVGHKTGATGAISSIISPTGGAIAAVTGRGTPVQITNLAELAAAVRTGTVTTTSNGATTYLDGGREPKGSKRPKIPGKATRAGNTIAGTIAAYFGPDIAGQLSQDIVWPWQKGPFSTKPQSDPIDRWIQNYEGLAPKATTLFDSLGQSIGGARVKAMLLGKDLHGVASIPVNTKVTTPGLPESRNAMKLYKGILSDAGKPVTTHITADTSRAAAEVNALAAHTAAVLNNAVTGFFGSAGTTAPPSAGRKRHPRATTAPPPASSAPPSGTVQRHAPVSIEVPVILDRREIARAFYSQVQDDLANR